jgi:RNA polymerase sigma factor (sigma-70 family)
MNTPDTSRDLEQFRAGDQRAFERIHARMAPALRLHVRSRIRSTLDPRIRARLDADEDDLLQEVWADLARQLPRFEHRDAGALLALLRTIAERTVIDRARHWRAAKRDVRDERSHPSNRESTDGSSHLHADIADTGPGVATGFASRDEQDRLHAAVAALSERDYTIILLRNCDQVEWEEIAAVVRSPSKDAVRMEHKKIVSRIVAHLSSPR